MQQSLEGNRPPRDRTLWFGVGAGVVAWLIHFFAIYILVDLFCRRAGLNFTFIGLTGLQFVLLALTVIGVGITAAASTLSYRHWQRLRRDDGRADTPETFAPGAERYRFMLFGGFVLNVVFIALMLLTSAVSFILPPCR